jgi:hypothetical protein
MQRQMDDLTGDGKIACGLEGDRRCRIVSRPLILSLWRRRRVRRRLGTDSSYRHAWLSRAVVGDFRRLTWRTAERCGRRRVDGRARARGTRDQNAGGAQDGDIKEVRSSTEPYTGLRHLSKLFRFMAIIMVLSRAEVATGLHPGVGIAARCCEAAG